MLGSYQIMNIAFILLLLFSIQFPNQKTHYKEKEVGN